MIKQIWTVRSLPKLLWGLSFAVSGVLIGYTLLCLPWLPDQVPLSTSGDRVASKWELLFVPVILLILCILFYLQARIQDLRKKHFRWLAGQPELREKQLRFYSDSSALACLFVTAAGMIHQTSRLNLAKELGGLPEWLPWVALALGFATIVYSEIKVRRMRTSADASETKES